MTDPTRGLPNEVLAKLTRAEVQFRRLTPVELHELPSPVVNGVELLLAAMDQWRALRVHDGADTASQPGEVAS